VVIEGNNEVRLDITDLTAPVHVEGGGLAAKTVLSILKVVQLKMVEQTGAHVLMSSSRTNAGVHH
jgi:hypothetical protein